MVARDLQVLLDGQVSQDLQEEKEAMEFQVLQALKEDKARREI